VVRKKGPFSPKRGFVFDKTPKNPKRGGTLNNKKKIKLLKGEIFADKSPGGERLLGGDRLRRKEGLPGGQCRKREKGNDR